MLTNLFLFAMMLEDDQQSAGWVKKE